jgi:hypothetical protein
MLLSHVLSRTVKIGCSSKAVHSHHTVTAGAIGCSVPRDPVLLSCYSWNSRLQYQWTLSYFCHYSCYSRLQCHGTHCHPLQCYSWPNGPWYSGTSHEFSAVAHYLGYNICHRIWAYPTSIYHHLLLKPIYYWLTLGTQNSVLLTSEPIIDPSLLSGARKSCLHSCYLHTFTV